MNAFRYALLIFVLSSSANVFAESRCDLEKPCIDARGVEIKITPVRPHGRRNFSPNDLNDQQKAKLDGMFSEANCADGVCVCEEKVDAVQIGTDSALNRELLSQSKSHQCSVVSAQIYYLPLEIYARPGLFSLAVYNLDYCQDCGGSCHGYFETTTFVKNMPVTMEAVVDKSRYNEIKGVLLQELRETDGARQSGGEWNTIAKASDEYLDGHFWTNGFFIEGGKVKFNFGEFLFGCAGGAFNPVEIPEKFIQPEFLALLNEAKKE